jgi:ribose transport system permease protein
MARILGNVPLNLIVWAPLSLVLVLGLRCSGFGRLAYAVGDNPLACRLAGVHVWQVLLGAYIVKRHAQHDCRDSPGGVQQRGRPEPGDALPSSVGGGGGDRRDLYLGRGGGTILGALILTVLDSLLTILSISQAGKQMLYGAIVLGLA